MASLTSVAITTRKAVRFTIYFIIFLIIARIALGLLSSVITKLFPAPPPAPTVSFNKLPTIPFPTQSPMPITYTVQTAEGSIPSLATQAKVYYMPQAHSDLLALDNAKTAAAALGFTGTATQTSSTLYQFPNSDNSSTLEMNIITKTFYIGSDLNSNPNILSQIPPSANDAAATAKNFLQSGNLLPVDLTGPVTPEFLKITNKQLVSAISQSEANLIKINLFRKDYDKLPSVTQNPQTANVWFILGGNQNQGKQIVGVQYYYYPVDETQFATYPLITSDAAFKELQLGKGYIANLGNGNTNKITIRRVYLAYYDPGIPMQFYQPVVVFEGDNNFVAYVPAVTSAYYGQ